MTRPHDTRMLSARGGCTRCGACWSGANAQALAARHYDKTRHPTWAEVTWRTDYGASAAAGGAKERDLFK